MGITLLKKITSAIKRPSLIVEQLVIKSSFLWPDKLYLSILYFLRFKKVLNWKNPQTFNEKLNWCKLNDRKPLYTKLADKYEVKELVKKLIGEEYIVPTYGVWSSYDEIDFNSLPNEFVLKATNDSSGVIICTDKNKLDYSKLKEKLNKSLKRNWYMPFREWVYKDIQPRILADKYLDEKTGKEIIDYKFWCFNGVPRVVYFTNKGRDIKENFYDMDFNPIAINHGFDRNVPEFDKPESFDLMKQLASKISQNIPFVRVDFFFVDQRVYFAECTFYDWAGLRPFVDYNMDLEIGRWITLS